MPTLLPFRKMAVCSSIMSRCRMTGMKTSAATTRKLYVDASVSKCHHNNYQHSLSSTMMPMSSTTRNTVVATATSHRTSYFVNTCSLPRPLTGVRQSQPKHRALSPSHSQPPSRKKATIASSSSSATTAIPTSTQEAFTPPQPAAATTFSSTRTARVTFRQLVRDAQTLLADVLRQPRTMPIPRWITPKHYQFTYAEVFGHSSFVLVAISYAVDDFLWLRILAVAGSTSMLFFTYFHPHGRILWLPFKWNALFIIINSYRIFNVYLKQFYAERLPEEFMKLRQKSFYLMDPVDFYRLMKIATIQEYKRGDMVLAQGSQIRCVRMVLDGKLKVLRDGQLTYLLEPGNFMSEAGIHIGMMIPGKIESCGTVVADGDADSETTRLLCWDRTELVRLLESHEGVRRSLKAILSWDVIRKLKAQRFLLEEMVDPEAWTARRKEQTSHRYAAILHAILQHPQYLHKFRKEVNKYRTIHHIDDAQHAQALRKCGWTVDEYEAGQRNRRKGSPVDDEEDNEDFFGVHGHDDEDDRDHVRNWQWYMHYLYLRLFG